MQTSIKQTSTHKPLSAFAKDELLDEYGQKIYVYPELQKSLLTVYKISYPNKYKWCVEQAIDPDNYQRTFYDYVGTPNYILDCHQAHQLAKEWEKPYELEEKLKAIQAKGDDSSGGVAQHRADNEEDCINSEERVQHISETLSAYSIHILKLNEWEKEQAKRKDEYDNHEDIFGGVLFGNKPEFTPTPKDVELFQLASSLEDLANHLRALAYFKH